MNRRVPYLSRPAKNETQEPSELPRFSTDFD
jgi:hypothetical protein